MLERRAFKPGPGVFTFELHCRNDGGMMVTEGEERVTADPTLVVDLISASAPPG